MKLLENWPMRPLVLITVILIGLSAQGCGTRGDIEPTDLSAIRIGATREQVESVLGKPIASEATASGTILTYVYDRGAMSGSILDPVENPILDALDWCQVPVACLAVGLATAPLWVSSDIIAQKKRHKETIRVQKGHLKVIYGPDDTAIHYVATLTRHQAEREIRELIKSGLTRQQAERITQELINAEQAYAEAHYQLYLSALHIKIREWAWKPLCIAANHGHGAAQHLVAEDYSWGDELRPDPGTGSDDFVQAYMWYSLAASNGHGPSESARNQLTTNMRPEQIAEAERLVREWKPGSCGL